MEWQPPERGICSWTTALIIGGVAAAAAGLAHDIQGFASGQTPWSNPGEWAKGSLIAGGEGFAGGFIGGALGPALGAAGDALGLTNAGTTAAAAGAPTPGLTGTISKAVGDVIGQTGLNATENVVGNAAKSALVGAGQGALQDSKDPLHGAIMGGLTGAAGGAAGGAVTNYGGAALGTQTPGTFFSPGPATEQFNYQPSTPNMTPIVPPAPPISTDFSYTPAGGVGGRAISNIGLPVASKLAGMGASQMVSQSMAPPPPPGLDNPYSSFGIRPYWTRP